MALYLPNVSFCLNPQLSKEFLENHKSDLLKSKIRIQNLMKICQFKINRTFFLRIFLYGTPGILLINYNQNSEMTFSENSIIQSLAYSTKSGLKIIDYIEGNGSKPEWGDFLIINYVLYISISSDLEQIDSTFERQQPFIFTHGGGQVIKGIEEAVHSMKPGGKRRVVLTEELGYTNLGLGPIPPLNFQRMKLFKKNAPFPHKEIKEIIVDIQLVDIKKNSSRLATFATDLNTNKEFQKILTTNH